MCKISHQEEEKKEEDKDTYRNPQDDVINEKVLIDRQNKLQLVLEYVGDNCTSDSEHDDIRNIYEALQAGDCLQGKVISGGFTNHSYQLYLKNQPTIKIFAKVSFSYALWCPGEKKHYDLDRQRCEFEAMKIFSESLATTDEGGKPVVTPYLLLDVSKDIRILVTEWASSTDEQWGNQFVDGEVDNRVLSKIATAIAKVGLTPVEDKNFNQGMLTGLREMFAAFQPIFDRFFEEENHPNPDKCIEYLQEMGKDRFLTIQEEIKATENQKDCLVHADAHVFNILVEAKPDIEKLDQFGKLGNVVLCDWEMIHVSCHGLDLGMLFYIPIACAYLHTAWGSLDKAQKILQCLDEIWDAYAACMIEEGGKDEIFLRDTFLNAIGFCGFRLFSVMYTCKGQVELLGNGNLTQEEMDRVISYVGLTGIQFEEFAFLRENNCDKKDLAGVREWFFERIKSTISEDIAKGRSSMQPRRRSSLLRTQGRRVSDAASSIGNFRSLSVLDLDTLDSDFISLHEEA